MHDYSWKLSEHNDDPSRTQAIRIGGDDRETKTFERSGSTRVMPAAKKTEEVIKPQYKPGPVMKVFGVAFSIMFALFCLGVIGITFAFILWKYYNHLFD